MDDKIGTAAEFKAIAPEAAMRWFKSKGYAFGFDWRDVWKEEHAIAFTVAKAASLDILQDIRGELEKRWPKASALTSSRPICSRGLQPGAGGADKNKKTR